MKVNGKDDIPYMENKIHVWNHQPEMKNYLKPWERVNMMRNDETSCQQQWWHGEFEHHPSNKDLESERRWQDPPRTRLAMHQFWAKLFERPQDTRFGKVMVCWSVRHVATHTSTNGIAWNSMTLLGGPKMRDLFLCTEQGTSTCHASVSKIRFNMYVYYC